MNVVIENCRSIDNASISIEPGKLNVKFAPNGTGKSSIAKALVSAVSESIGPDLVPFKWQKEGSAEKHRWRAQTWCKSVLRSVAASPDVTPS